MKSIEEYMSLPYKMEIEPDSDEGGFVVSFPELPGCISSGGDIQEAVSNAKDAQKAWFEAAIEDGISINEPLPVEKYSGQFKLRLPKSLHKRLAEESKSEGISMNQYCVYLLAQGCAYQN